LFTLLGRRALLILGLLLACAGQGRAQTYKQSNYCGGVSSGGTCAYSTNTTATDTNLIFILLGTSATSISVTDSHNTYTQLSTTNCSGNYLITAFEADNIFGGADTLTISWTGGGTADAIPTEYSGLAASALDKTHCGTGTIAGASSGATATTSFANELIVGFGGGCCGAWSSEQVNGSATGVNVRQSNVNAAYEAMWDANVTSTGTQTASGTAATAVTWSLFVATFKASSQPGGAASRIGGPSRVGGPTRTD